MNYNPCKHCSSSNWKKQECLAALSDFKWAKYVFSFQTKPRVHLPFYLFSGVKAICEPLSTEHLHSEYSSQRLIWTSACLIPRLSQQVTSQRCFFFFLPNYSKMQYITATGWVSNYGYLSEKLPSRCLNENAISPEHLLISYSNYIDSTLPVTRGHDGSDGQCSTNGVGCGKAVRLVQL